MTDLGHERLNIYSRGEQDQPPFAQYTPVLCHAQFENYRLSARRLTEQVCFELQVVRCRCLATHSRYQCGNQRPPGLERRLD